MQLYEKDLCELIARYRTNARLKLVNSLIMSTFCNFIRLQRMMGNPIESELRFQASHMANAMSHRFRTEIRVILLYR